jgi:hypothetical protein
MMHKAIYIHRLYVASLSLVTGHYLVCTTLITMRRHGGNSNDLRCHMCDLMTEDKHLHSHATEKCVKYLYRQVFGQKGRTAISLPCRSYENERKINSKVNILKPSL